MDAPDESFKFTYDLNEDVDRLLDLEDKLGGCQGTARARLVGSTRGLQGVLGETAPAAGSRMERAASGSRRGQRLHSLRCS